MNNRRRIETREGFDIYFTPESEDMTAREHFIDECGWTEKQFDKIRNYDFFCAHVEAERAGIVLGEAYLGCCCELQFRDFWEREGDYFDSMVDEAITAAKQKLEELNR